MANNYWLDVSTDWTAAANWSTGAAPTSSDTAYILSGSKAITNVPAATAGVNYAGLVVGPGFTGSIGTAALPLYVGTVTAAIKIDALQATAIYLAVDTGDSSSIDIYSSSGKSTDPVYLTGAGTWARVAVHRAQLVRISATATVTTMFVGASARVVIASGATVTTVYQSGGSVECLAAVTTINVNSGVWNHMGDTTYNVTTLTVTPGGRFNFASDGGTITTANLMGGTIDGNQGNGRARTITTLNQYAGTMDRRGIGASVTITNNNQYGGDSFTGPPFGV